MKQKSTVLVIDDYPPAADAVKFTLKDKFVCLSAGSAKQGLEILRSNPVDAVVLDIRMPEMDGMEALKRIKEMGMNVQVILLTGHGSLDTARKAVRYGAFDYLIKPFDTVNLRNVVTEAVEKKRLLEKEGRDTELEKLAEYLTAKLGEASRLARASELSCEALREMKNPLTAILGYSQMLLKKVRGRRVRVFSGKSVRYLSIIEEEARKCVEIALGLMSLSEENRSREGAVLNEAIVNVAALVRPQCSMSGIELLVSPPEEKVIVDAPADDVHTVLVNVVLNSMESIAGPGEIGIKGYRMSEGGRLLDAAPRSEEEFPRNAPENSLAAIEVRDTGGGIDPKHLDKVFEPFFTTKADRGCRGLGLSICKEKVERCGGRVGVVSSGAAGTTMRILLPVSSRV